MKKSLLLLPLLLVSLASCDALVTSSDQGSHEPTSTPGISTPGISSSLTPDSSSSGGETSGAKKLKTPQLAADQTTYLIPNSHITITKGNYYTSIEEVAAYVMAFKFLPDNFVQLNSNSDRGTCIAQYSNQCRLYKHPYHNDNSGKYTSPYLTDGASDYYEADMESESGSYDPFSRGKYRIVFSVEEGHEILYYTDDHYLSYSEYYNYHGGWGAWWGTNFSSTHPDALKAWPIPQIVDSIDFSKKSKQ